MCAGNTLKGTVTVQNNSAGVELVQNQIQSNTYVNGNSGVGSYPDDKAPEIEANTITGDLSCASNSPAPTNDTHPNNVSGNRSGQCATPGF